MICRACTRCQSPDIIKNGRTPTGQQKFICKTCGFASTLDPKEAEWAARYAVVDKLQTERLSQRAIARLTGVSRVTITKRLRRKAVRQVEAPTPATDEPELELDEMWSYVSSTSRQVWTWLALERATRRIVGVQIGERTDSGARLLLESIPAAFRKTAQFFIDGLESCQKVLPFTRHTFCSKQSGLTSHIKRFNNTVRQRCPNYVRKTLSFSKDMLLHAVRTWLFVDEYNRTLVSV